MKLILARGTIQLPLLKVNIYRIKIMSNKIEKVILNNLYTILKKNE